MTRAAARDRPRAAREIEAKNPVLRHFPVQGAPFMNTVAGMPTSRGELTNIGILTYAAKAF
jgi:hypothetical protein